MIVTLAVAMRGPGWMMGAASGWAAPAGAWSTGEGTGKGALLRPVVKFTTALAEGPVPGRQSRVVHWDAPAAQGRRL